MSNANTAPRIKKLSPLLINQLAAGEVVTRPAAVVKELLENAIDAGATKIEVSITEGGMGMISVADNGSGILPDDMVMAITRHATSKVADVANLQGINTLGFRGEALAAITAVSRLDLTSSPDDSGIGRKISVAGVLADSPKLTPVIHPKGTCVIVKDLYFNVPARRGNLKSIATEFSYIEAIVRDVALAVADVQLTLSHDQKLRLSLPATGDNHQKLPLSRLEQALGVTLEPIAKPLFVDLSSLMDSSTAANQLTPRQAAIDGWLLPQSPNITMPKLIYVNGRLIKDQVISNELQKLAQRFLPSGLGFLLYLTLPSDWVNVNVHPEKQRIKISPLANILAHLRHNVELVLKQNYPQNENQAQNQTLTAQNANILAENHDKTFAKPLNVNANYRDYGRQNSSTSRPRQVQSPRQSYQSATLNQAPIIDNQKNSPSQNITPKSVNNLQCLSVIKSYPQGIENTQITAPLPWLLIQINDQFLLVSSKIVSALTLADNQSLLNDAEITLASMNQLFSQEDLPKFTAKLFNQAFSVLSADELIRLMLTATLADISVNPS